MEPQIAEMEPAQLLKQNKQPHRALSESQTPYTASSKTNNLESILHAGETIE